MKFFRICTNEDTDFKDIPTKYILISTDCDICFDTIKLVAGTYVLYIDDKPIAYLSSRSVRILPKRLLKQIIKVK